MNARGLPPGRLAGIPSSKLSIDDRFCFSFPLEQETLFASIATRGVLCPLWAVESTGTEPLIISGFRRLAATKSADVETLPVIVFTGADWYGLYLKHVAVNAFQRSMNLVEQARAVRAAVEGFGRSGDEVIATLLPALGLDHSAGMSHLFILEIPLHVDKRRI